MTVCPVVLLSSVLHTSLAVGTFHKLGDFQVHSSEFMYVGLSYRAHAPAQALSCFGQLKLTKLGT